MQTQDQEIVSEAQNALAAEPMAAPEEVLTTLKQVKKEQRRLLLRSPGFIFGALVLLFWVVSSLVPDLIATWDPKDTVRLDSGESIRSTSPDGNAWFGTDRLGRDVFSRVIHGARPIMLAAPLATLLAMIVGTLLGMFTGYYRGLVDEVISRILEAILSIPAILLAIVIVVTFGPTQPTIIGTIAFLFIAPVARTVRAATLAESQLDYVTAARMRGESSLFIITQEIFPNVIGVCVVEATVRLGYAVFTLATLAFLGLTGGNQTDANWGVDISANYNQIVADVWWPTIFPALAIASLVIGVNLMADAVEKAVKS